MTGIGTDVGKTIASAILCQRTGADYWKPIQSGGLEDNTDRETLKHLITNTKTKFHNESYLLNKPFSPHLAAIHDSVTIDINRIKIPTTSNNLIIEGAGGIMVPISEDKYMIDLIQYLNVEVVIVSKNYLGSINHTLMTIDLLKSRNIPIAGIIFNDDDFGDNIQFISNSTQINIIGHIKREKIITPLIIQEYALSFNFEFI